MNIRIQFFSLLFSFLLFGVIWYFLRKKVLKEEYSILWFITIFLFIFVSIYRPIIEYIAYVLGVAYPPAAVFIIVLGCFVLLNIHYSIEISKIKEKNKILAQELSLLQGELMDLKESLKKDDQ